MKDILTVILLFFFLGVNAQDWSAINADLNLSDSLTHPTEIRIYQTINKTNYNSLFRMYKDGADQWTAEFHEHWAKVDGVMEQKSKKKILTSKSEMEYVYLKLFRSHMFDLPNRRDISWKLQERGEIEKIERIKRGQITNDYDILSKQSMPLDGTGFYFKVRNPNKSNEFEFGNPFWYKEKYPGIDEPIYVCELIEIIRNEFEIWKD